MAQVLHDPRDTGTADRTILFAALVAAVIAFALLAAIYLSGPHGMERFAQGAYNCRPFVGQTPYC